ncbi:Fic family protein, partial [Acidobacteriia bacterium AH_259_A11_L15]|nr:Fic family protein [Acidobacteriia bacterium AH_259_A11_L15]
PGQIRRYEVGVARYKGAPAEDCEYLLDSLCEWLNSDTFTPTPEMAVVYAIVKAVFTHLYLAWIHPFGDGNGRTARLMEFQILMGSGVPAPSAHLLSNHYNQTRSEYYRLLDQSSHSGGEVLPFLMYAVQGFLDGLQSQLDVIRYQQWDIAWRNYVHEAFKDKSSQSSARRRRLVLDLSRQPEPVPLAKLPEISPKVAAAYAQKTTKTLSRDLNALLQMDLVEKTKGGFRARKEIVLRFLPPRADEG